MAPEKPDREPTLFEVLSISPRSLDGQDPASQAKIARQAYRRALLKHHPDRQAQNTTDENAAAASDSSSSSASNKSSSSQQHFTVDQITEAYTVLSDAKKRREYTRTLRSQTRTTVSSGAYANTRRRRKSRASSGTDVLVLDDDMSWDGKRKLYYHACEGCGKARGFGLKEDEIHDDSEEDLELTLQCVGCEKSLKVLVPALDDRQWGEQGNFGMQTQQQAQTYNMAPQPQTSKKDEETPKKSRGWGFRLGLGLSLGGGASARAGAGR